MDKINIDNNQHIFDQVFQYVMNFEEQKSDKVGLFNDLGISDLWFSHKTTSKRNNKDSYKKIECFGYFKNEDKEDMINYLNSPEFKYADRSDGNYSIFFDMAVKTVGKLTTSDLKDYEGVGFGYRQEFCKVLIHRREFYLIRAYFLEKKGNEDFSNGYFKLEITYREVENKKLRRKVSSKLNKPNAIIEIIKKIEKFGNGFLPILNKDDYSNGIPFETFYKSISKGK